jgi:hypothetical protein
MQTLLAPTGALDHLSQAQAATVTGKQFFPHLVASSFHNGLIIVFGLAIAMSLIGAVASLARGTRYVHDEQAGAADELVLVEAEGSGAIPYVEDVHVGPSTSGGRR